MKLIDMLVEDGLNGWQWPAGVKCITQDYGSGPVYRGVVFGYREEPYLKKNIWLANSGNGHADVTIKRYDSVADDWATAIITREQYEAALAAKSDGWIDWGGGECPPVSTNAVVDVKLRCGSVTARQPAGVMNWRSNSPDEPGDIIAYRLHQPQKSAQVKADDEADLNECIGQGAVPVWGGEGLPPTGVECELSNAVEFYTHSGSVDFEEGTPVVVGGKVNFGLGDFVAVKVKGTNCITNINPCFLRPLRTEAERKREEAVKKIMLTGWCQAAAEEIYDLVAAGKVPGVKLED